MIRLAIYDDNQQRRESLETLLTLNPEIEWVGSFPDCSDVLAEMESLHPDLVLMDIGMPHVNGIEGVGLIKGRFPNIKVIMQTVFENEEKIFAALQAGADGYILKNSSPEKLLQSIDDVSKGGAYLTPSVALRVMKHFEQKVPAKAAFNLSAREQEVLVLLTEGNSYKMAADKLSVSYFTVNSHVKKIYEKLQVHSVTEAVSVALKNKLV